MKHCSLNDSFILERKRKQKLLNVSIKLDSMNPSGATWLSLQIKLTLTGWINYLPAAACFSKRVPAGGAGPCRQTLAAQTPGTVLLSLRVSASVKGAAREQTFYGKLTEFRAKHCRLHYSFS